MKMHLYFHGPQAALRGMLYGTVLVQPHDTVEVITTHSAAPQCSFGTATVELTGPHQDVQAESLRWTGSAAKAGIELETPDVDGADVCEQNATNMQNAIMK